MTIGGQVPELDWGAFWPPPPYKIGSQNTPYKLRLKKLNCAVKLLAVFTIILDLAEA